MTVSLPATSVTPQARIWLQATSYVRVLHVFDRVCNVIGSKPGVVSMVTQDVGPGPLALVVPEVTFTGLIAPADTGEYAGEVLTVGQIKVDLRQATIWNPIPPWARFYAHRKNLCSKLPILLDVLKQQASPDSLAALVVDLPAPRSIIVQELLAAASLAVEQYLDGLQQQDEQLLLAGVRGLAGLGGGLTPAGDDWLVGSALAVWTGVLPAGVKPAVQQALEFAAERTNLLSAAWLQAAARGECHLLWHKLFEGLIASSNREVAHVAQAIIRQGHTSGADALAGFIATLRTAEPA